MSIPVFASLFLMGMLMQASDQVAGLTYSGSASATSSSSSRFSGGLFSPVSYSSTHSSGNGHAIAFASATSSGSNSQPTIAEARSNSNGPGSDSEAVSIAKDGASVKTESNAVSNGQPTTARTVATGEGSDAVIDQNNTVIGDERHPVSVEYYTEKLQGGALPLDLLSGMRGGYQTDDMQSFVMDLWTALHQGGDVAKLYSNLAESFFADTGCENFKKLFEGHLSKFLAISDLSIKLDVCFFPHCESLDSARYCCGEAQKQYTHCGCESNGCRWSKPTASEQRMSGHFFWKCDKCGGEAEACRCF